MRFFIAFVCSLAFINLSYASDIKVPGSDKRLCEYYKYDYTDTAIADDLIKRDGDLVLFQSGNPEVPVVVKLSDLKNFAFETTAVRSEQNAIALKKKLMRVTLANSILVRKRYFQMFPKLFYGVRAKSTQISNCFARRDYLKDLQDISLFSEESEFSQSNESQEEITTLFMKDHILAAVIMRRLFARIKSTKKMAQDKIETIQNLQRQRAYTDGDRVLLQTKEKLDREIRALLSHLSYFINKYPILAGFENDWSITKWTNLKFKISDFGKRLSDGFDPKTANYIVDKFLLEDQHTEQDLDKLLGVFSTGSIGQYLKKFIAYKDDKNGRMRNVAKGALTNHIKRINGQVLSLCENENLDNLMVESGKDSIKLYHNPMLVAKIFDESVLASIYVERFKNGGASGGVERRNVVSSKSAITSVIRDQSGYCHLMSIDPPSELNYFTWKTFVGTAMALFGGLLFFFTGGVGTMVVVLLVGGAGFTGIDIGQRHNYIANTVEGQRLLSLGGWADLQKLAFYESALREVWIDGAMEVAFTYLGIRGVTQLTKKSIMSRGGLDVSQERAVKGALGTRVHAYKQGRNNQYLLMQYDSESYISGLWARYDSLAKKSMQTNEVAKINAIEDLSIDWMIWNRKPVAAEHLLKTSETNKGLYSSVRTMVADPSSANGQEVFAHYNGKLDTYFKYRTPLKGASNTDSVGDIDRMARSGMQSGIQSEELAKFIQKHTVRPAPYFAPRMDAELAAMERSGKGIPVSLTKVDPITGVKTTEVEIFGSRSILNSEQLVRQNRYRNTFASTPLDELLGRSDLIERMGEQAQIYRELKYIEEKLMKINKLTSDQKKLLTRIRIAFGNNRELKELEIRLMEVEARKGLTPAQKELLGKVRSGYANARLRPRTDFFVKHLISEKWAERKLYLFSSQSSMKKIIDNGYPLGKAEEEALMNSSIVSKLISGFTDNKVTRLANKHKFIATMLFVPVTTQGLASVAMVLKYNNIFAGINLPAIYWGEKWREFSRIANNGFTEEEWDCALGGGKYGSFVGCYVKSAIKEIAWEIQITIYDDDFRFDENLEIQKKLARYAYSMINLRTRTHWANIYSVALGSLNSEYALVGIRRIIEVLELREYPDGDIGSYAFNVMTAKDGKAFKKAMGEYREIYKDKYVQLLTDVHKRRKEIESSMKNVGALPSDLEQNLFGRSPLESLRELGTAETFVLQAYAEAVKQVKDKTGIGALIPDAPEDEEKEAEGREDEVSEKGEGKPDKKRESAKKAG